MRPALKVAKAARMIAIMGATMIDPDGYEGGGGLDPWGGTSPFDPWELQG